MPRLVSVLMPVYNAERYVEAAVRSILQQTYSDWELIIIDDGSCDHSADLLYRLAQEEPRIRLLHRPNMGIASTRNELLHMAQGEYIALLDADDLALPERLTLQVEYLNAHEECVAVGSQALLIDPDGAPIAPWGGTRYSHHDIDHELLNGGWPIINSTHMMRTKIVRQLGGYRNFPSSEDHDLYLRLAEIGQLHNLEAILCHYRLHLKSNVLSRTQEFSQIINQIIHEAYQRRGRNDYIPEILSTFKALNPIDHQKNWVWWALKSRNTATARKYIWRIIKQEPFSFSTWKMLGCVIRGY